MALGLAEALVLPLIALFGAGSLGAVLIVAAPHREARRLARNDDGEQSVCPSRALASDGLALLRSQHDKAAIALVRRAVWTGLQAGSSDTLQDVLARPGAPELRDVLIALERGAFTSDGDLQDAVFAACSALELLAQ